MLFEVQTGLRSGPAWNLSVGGGTYRFGEELVAQALLEAEEDAIRAGDLLELALRRYPDLDPSLSWLELANAVGRESLGLFSARTFFLRAIETGETETGGAWELQRSQRLVRGAVERYETQLSRAADESTATAEH